MTQVSFANRDLSLAEAVDHLLNRGVILSGDVALTLAGVDLVYLKLHLMLASAETVREKLRLADGEEVTADWLPWREQSLPQPPALGRGAAPEMHQAEAVPSILGGPLVAMRGGLASRAQTGILPPTERPDSALAQLVLTVMELLRQLMERQALRRIEGRSLPPDVEERMGLALQALEEKVRELREVFGLKEADINIDLGPLGRLL